MTTATADHQQRLDHLETEKADYASQLGNVAARLDVLRREAREAGPSATRAQKIRELEADDTRLRGLLAQIERDHAAASVSLRNAENAARRDQNAATMAAQHQQLARRAEALLTVRAAFLVLQDAIFAAQTVNTEAMLTGRQAREAARDTAILDGLDPDELGLEMHSAISGVLHTERLRAEDCGYLSLPALPTVMWPLDRQVARADLLADLERVK